LLADATHCARRESNQGMDLRQLQVGVGCMGLHQLQVDARSVARAASRLLAYRCHVHAAGTAAHAAHAAHALHALWRKAGAGLLVIAIRLLINPLGKVNLQVGRLSMQGGSAYMRRKRGG